MCRRKLVISSKSMAKSHGDWSIRIGSNLTGSSLRGCPWLFLLRSKYEDTSRRSHTSKEIGEMWVFSIRPKKGEGYTLPRNSISDDVICRRENLRGIRYNARHFWLILDHYRILLKNFFKKIFYEHLCDWYAIVDHKGSWVLEHNVDKLFLFRGHCFCMMDSKS